MRLLQLFKTEAVDDSKEFLLSSGARSNYYIDAKQVTLSQEGARLIGELILNAIENIDVEAIGGPEIGAIPIVDAVLYLAKERGRDLSGFYVKKNPKDHGKRQWLEGPLRVGVRVAIVDDVVTSGHSILRAIHTVEQEADCEVAIVIVLVDRMEGAKENLTKAGYIVQSIFTCEDFGLCERGSMLAERA